MNFPFSEHSGVLKYEDEFEKLKSSYITHFDGQDPAKYLGLTCCDYYRQTVKANYFIGLDWLEEGKHSISVAPKIAGLDYFKMFMTCFDCEDKEVIARLNRIYHIDFDRPFIRQSDSRIELTPLLIIHFLQLTAELVKKGLKKDYVLREENLSGKLKGKLLFTQHLKQNIVTWRNDRNYCRYQDYSDDCIENQILKKTLLFCSRYLAEKEISCCPELHLILQHCLSYFGNVSDCKDIYQIKQFRINPLYKEYKDALRVAKMILRRFSYDINGVKEDADLVLPPFWIDMPLLFEVYVLALLRRQFKLIQYQVKGNYGKVDFLKADAGNPVIIDTKYKPSYSSRLVECCCEEECPAETEPDGVTDLERILKEVDGRFTIEDMRQLSGYARDERILRKLGVMKNGRVDPDVVVPCLIIYPLDRTVEDLPIGHAFDFERPENKIPQFTKFYKFGVRLPVL